MTIIGASFGLPRRGRRGASFSDLTTVKFTLMIRVHMAHHEEAARVGQLPAQSPDGWQ